MNSGLSNTARNRLGQLSSLSLPVLPGGALSLMQSLSNDDFSYRELAELIENFPGIAGKLISLANSAWSSPATEITSVEIACARLGTDVVKSVSIAILVSSSFSPNKCPHFDAAKYWCSALLTAEFAFRLTRICRAETGLEASTARTAGLLHNLGLLWLADQLPDEIDRALQKNGKDGTQCLQRRLIEILEFDQADAGGILAKLWELPDALVHSANHYLDAGYDGRHRDLVLTIGLSARLVSIILRGEEPHPEHYNDAQQIGVAQQELAEVIDQIIELVPRTRASARIFAKP